MNNLIVKYIKNLITRQIKLITYFLKIKIKLNLKFKIFMIVLFYKDYQILKLTVSLLLILLVNKNHGL